MKSVCDFSIEKAFPGPVKPEEVGCWFAWEPGGRPKERYCVKKEIMLLPWPSV